MVQHRAAELRSSTTGKTALPFLQKRERRRGFLRSSAHSAASEFRVSPPRRLDKYRLSVFEKKREISTMSSDSKLVLAST